jgi:DNA-binding LytR/AlgR family response regulator
MDKIRVVIVEDEPVTARNLAHVLQNVDENIIVTISLPDVKEAVEWFNANPSAYDLVFMDIRLADGVSFDIFKQAEILKPVIFVTAYNDYAIQAFKNNGIDYILKPFDEAEIELAVNKFKRWIIQSPKNEDNQPFAQLLAQMKSLAKPHKKSFLVHFRDKLIPVETVKIAWFYTAHEIVYAQTTDGQQYNIEFTMEQLEQQLEPDMFFRANRQFIINRKALTEVDFYFNGRLSLKMKPEPPEKILISKARVPEFKKWVDS